MVDALSFDGNPQRETTGARLAAGPGRSTVPKEAMTMLDRRVWRWLALLPVLFSVSGIVCGQGGYTISVQPGEPIQEEIDRAPAGSMICLAAGTWQENLVVDKSLVIRGAGADKSLIVGQVPGLPVISIGGPEGTQVELRGFAVADAVWATPRTWREVGILIAGEVQADIEVITVSSNWTGVSVTETAVLSVTASGISNNGRYGITVRDAARLYLVESTIVDNGRCGVFLDDSAYASLTGSSVKGNGNAGVVLEQSAEAKITTTVVEAHDESGIEVWDSCMLTIEDCTVTGNTQTGIVVGHEAQLILSGSTVSGNGRHGVEVADQAHAVLEANSFARNQGFGVALFEAPCFDWRWSFRGFLSGYGNRLPDPNEPDGNVSGACCPESLAFLCTEEGGALDRRE